MTMPICMVILVDWFSKEDYNDQKKRPTVRTPDSAAFPEQLQVPEEYGKGTNMVQLTYANQGWRCTSPTLSEHLCSTRSVCVLKRCSESVWKVHKRHAWSTQKVSSRYQAVNHLRDYFSWITSRRQAQFLADLYLSWSVMPRFVLTTHMTERAVAQ